MSKEWKIERLLYDNRGFTMLRNGDDETEEDGAGMKPLSLFLFQFKIPGKEQDKFRLGRKVKGLHLEGIFIGIRQIQ